MAIFKHFIKQKIELKFVLFFMVQTLYTLLAPHIKKLETYFDLIYVFLDFPMVCDHRKLLLWAKICFFKLAAPLAGSSDGSHFPLLL